MNLPLIIVYFYQIFLAVLAVMSFTLIKHRAGLFLALAIGSAPVAFLYRKILLWFYGFGDFSRASLSTGMALGTLINIAGAVLMLLAILELRKAVILTAGSTISQTTQLNMPANIKFGNVMWYVVLFVGAVGFYLIGFILLQSYDTQNMGIVLVLSGFIILIAAVVYLMIMLYRIWRFVIYQTQRYQLTASIDTPGKAVGFLFIPLFNLYWVFIAYGKLPKDLNAIAVARGEEPSMPEGLAFVIAVLMAVSIIPFVGYVTGIIANAILLPIFLSQVIRVCNAMLLHDRKEIT